MPRNRDFWKKLELHIRSNLNSLYGMNSTFGANELRRTALAVTRHARTYKSRKLAVAFTIRRMKETRQSGYIEAMNPAALEGICELTVPIWDQMHWDPITPDELSNTMGE